MKIVKYGLDFQLIKYPVSKYGRSSHQTFFGYYDITPINKNSTILLANQTGSSNKPPTKNSNLLIGYYILGKPGHFNKVAETTTWCWQQGCRLQWYPMDSQGENNLIIYNSLVDGQYGCCIQNIRTQKKICQYPRPIYALSRDGSSALSLNFSRLGRLRPGYGYVNIPDETYGQKAPEEDGIWLMDMKSQETCLLFSILDMTQFYPLETMKGAEHYFNHISVGPDSNRFFFYHIWVNKTKRYTRLISSNMDGSDPYLLVDGGHVSHYAWKSNNEILCFSIDTDTDMKYHLYQDKSLNRRIFSKQLPCIDGHPSFSPCDQFLITDTYPDTYGFRKLLRLDINHDKLLEIGAFHDPWRYKGEVRCDLHPRWSPDGNYVCIDSAMEGYRSLYVIDLKSKSIKRNEI